MLANQAPSPYGDSPPGDSDYDTILTALMETARGEAFLREYARRIRSADTATLLTAIGRIEDLLRSRASEPGADADDFQAAPPEPSPAEDPTVGIAAIEQTTPVTGIAGEIGLETDVAAISTSRVIVSGGYHAQAGAAAVKMPGIDFVDHDGPDNVTVAAAIRPEKVAIASRAFFADIRALSDEEKIALFT